VKIVNTNRYYLYGTGTAYLHLATVQDSLREYICFYRIENHKLYIEEITTGQLEIIKNEERWLEIYLFLVEKGALKEPFTPNEAPKISIQIPRKRFKTP